MENPAPNLEKLHILGMKPEIVTVGNLINRLFAMKLERIDAAVACEGYSGDRRVLGEKSKLRCRPVHETGASKGLAAKLVSQFSWQESGRGTGRYLPATVKNIIRFNYLVAIPSNANLKIEVDVDARFLP